MEKDKPDDQGWEPLHRSSEEDRAAKKAHAAIAHCDCCGAVIPNYRFNTGFKDDETLSCMVCGYASRFLRAL